MANGKAKRLSEFLRVFPECVGRCIFVGDNGQGDLDLVRLLDTTAGMRFAFAFIHNVFPTKGVEGEGGEGGEGGEVGRGLALYLPSSPRASRKRTQRRGSPSPGSERAEQRTKRWSLSSLKARFLQSSMPSSPSETGRENAEKSLAASTSPPAAPAVLLKSSSATRRSRSKRRGSHSGLSAHARQKNPPRSASLPPLSNGRAEIPPPPVSAVGRFREGECPPTCVMFDSYPEAAARALELGCLSHDGAQRVGQCAMAEFASISFSNPAQEAEYGRLLKHGLSLTP